MTKTCWQPFRVVWQNVFCYHPFVQSFDTKTDDLRPGACIRLELPDGNELAVFNVDGEYYAIDNICPHKGAPLSEGALCGHIVECGLHGWQFDVRSGECLTVPDRIKSYKVKLENGSLKIANLDE